MRHLTCDPNAEVIGAAAQAYLENVRSESTKPLLEAHDLGTIDADKWYSVQSVLDVLNDLAQQPDVMSNFVAIGLKIAEKAFIPPQITQLDQILMGLNDVYQMNHRNGDVGYMETEKVGDTHYKLHLHDVYPDDFTYGILYGFARRFLPQGTQFTVTYENPAIGRDRGGSETIIHVEWV
jgi:hypothetical protein